LPSSNQDRRTALRADESAVDISEEIDQLSKKSQQLTKDIYSDLTPWQITKIARHPSGPTRWTTSTKSSPTSVELHGDRTLPTT
jgi:acetyl-CoA carboxylase carboxyl transferase subunit alpha